MDPTTPQSCRPSPACPTSNLFYKILTRNGRKADMPLMCFIWHNPGTLQTGQQIAGKRVGPCEDRTSSEILRRRCFPKDERVNQATNLSREVENTQTNKFLRKARLTLLHKATCDPKDEPAPAKHRRDATTSSGSDLLCGGVQRRDSGSGRGFLTECSADPWCVYCVVCECRPLQCGQRAKNVG